MTDRELLELAAKAAKISVSWDDQTGMMFDLPSKDLGKGIFWNPLNDDGDALRLAVLLGIDILQFSSSEYVEAWKHPNQTTCEEDYGANPYSATRRAIVRAAAEIGKAMK